MISPKYAPTHALQSIASFKGVSPHVINLYLDYDCPFSAKLFLKFKSNVIPQVEKTYPGKFQFVFMNVIQPWHPNSVYMHEFALSVAKLIRESDKGDAQLFWSVSESLFKNIKKFYDNANSESSRNQIYAQLYDVVASDTEIPFTKEEVLSNLVIKQVSNEKEYSNSGNGVTNDVKYFTRYQRTVGVHMTPTVSVNGIANPSIESSTEPDDLVKIFGSNL